RPVATYLYALPTKGNRTVTPVLLKTAKEIRMRPMVPLLAAAMLTSAASLARSAECRLTPKEVVTQFMTQFYIRKQVRKAFETWVDPGYIQHNPLAATGRDAA